MSGTVPRWAQRAGQLFGATSLPFFAGLLGAWMALAQRSILYGDHPAAWRLVVIGAAGTVGWLTAGWTRGRARQFISPVASALASGLAYLAVRPSQSLAQLAWFAGALLIALVAASLLKQRRWSEDAGEAWRWSFMLVGISLAAAPFFSRDGIGGGDAFWYYTMLADYTEQVRAGVFPVWVGQSDYAFNGTVFPLRVAPLYQLSGGVVDALTGHILKPVSLANALFVSLFLVTGFIAYFSFADLTGRQRTLATGVALLWLASPCVQTPVYVFDQFMTFSALAFVPWLFWSCHRYVHQPDRLAEVSLGASLGMIWLGHLPIALWSSLFAAIIVLPSAWARRQEATIEMLRLARAGSLFALIGLFPVSSVADLDNRQGIGANGAHVVPQIEATFPRNLRPVTPFESDLANYQLGYAFILLLLVVTLIAARSKERGRIPLVCVLWIPALFVFPFPYFSSWLWSNLPSWFISVNNLWPMQRIFPIWGGLIGSVASLVLLPKLQGAWRLGLAFGVGILMLGWTGLEGHRLQARARAFKTTPEDAALYLAPRNAVLTRYSYTPFQRAPDYATHGYADPRLEFRLFDEKGTSMIASNSEAAAPLVSEFSPGPHARQIAHGVAFRPWGEKGVIPTLTPSFDLAKNGHYALRIRWIQPWTGSIRLKGRDLHREYILPDSGGGMNAQVTGRSFGALTTSSRVIPLSVGETAQGVVFQVVSSPPPSEMEPLFEYSVFQYKPEELPVRVKSLIPIEASVELPRPSLLETPRVWIKGWIAEVNGVDTPTVRTGQDLVGVPLPAGPAVVKLRFSPSLWVKSHFYLAVGALLVVAVYLIRRLLSPGSAQGTLFGHQGRTA